MKSRTQAKVTLKDIAVDTDLSISTVSRALARIGKISDKNEKRIFDSAQRLGYPIKHFNTPLELRKNIFIALITSFQTGEFYSSLFDGFNVATKDTNANIALINVSDEPFSEVDLVHQLQQAKFDAAVVFLPHFNQTDYTQLIEKTDPNFPIISVAHITSPVMDTITFDNYGGGYSVGNHFLNKGYKKLGIINGPSNKSEAMLRKNGFLDFIDSREELSLVWQYDGDYDPKAGNDAYIHYKNAKIKPEAIFCSNDSMAVGLMHAALRDGKKIPNDFAVVGYDDLPICQYHTPTITSIHTPYEVLGKKSIEYLLNRLKHTNKVEHGGFTSLIPVSLKVRESTEGFE